MNPDHAFSRLEPFTSFSDGAFDRSHYIDLPADWLILSADIENSTRAVANGQYEAVNFVGAACIAALNRALPELEYPKVFGGDGAQAVIPPEYRRTATKTLQQLAHWAASAYQLNLIIGIVPVADIIANGGSLSAGKMRSATGVDIAMFHGNGLSMAETMILDDVEQRYRLDTEPQPQPDLGELSCRWSPIEPSRDCMLCLIIGAREQHTSAGKSNDRPSDETMIEVITQINKIVGLNSDITNPAAASKLKFKVRNAAIKKELSTQPYTGYRKYLSILAFQLFAWILFKFGLKAGEFDPTKYKAEIANNSDYVKVAGSVRMVLDCTKAQASQIEQLLEQRYQSDKLVYGMYRAKQALMTCITPDVTSGDHIHYIDGSHGGLWNAAGEFKARAKSKTRVKSS